MTRIGRVIQQANPRKPESYWTLDAVMVVLGGILLWMVSTHLRFDDNRPQYNAWTYLIAVPTILVLISLLLRFFVGKFVERSMQIAFLLSVTVHLILLLAAVNMIIFSRWWPDIYEAISQQVPKEQTAKQYFSTAQAKSVTGKRSSRPDYLRAVETEHEATEEELSADGAIQLAVQEQSELPTLQPDEQRQQNIQAALMERAEIVPTAPSHEPQMAELSRAAPEVLRPARQKVDLPQITPAANAADSMEVDANAELSSLSRSDSNLQPSPIEPPQTLDGPESTTFTETTRPAPIRRADSPSLMPQDMGVEAGGESLTLQKASAAQRLAVRAAGPRVVIPERPIQAAEEVSTAEPTAEQLERMMRTDASRTALDTPSTEELRPMSSVADIPNATSFNTPRQNSSLAKRNREVEATTQTSLSESELQLSKSAPMLPRRSASTRAPIVTPNATSQERNDSNELTAASKGGTTTLENLAELMTESPSRTTRSLPNPVIDGFKVENAAPSQQTSLPFQRKGLDAIAEETQGDLGGVSASPHSEGKKLSGELVRRPGSRKTIEIPVVPGRAERDPPDTAKLADPATIGAEASKDESDNPDAAEIALDLVSELERQEPNSVAADRVLDVDATDGVGGLLKNAEGGNRLTERKSLQPLSVPQELVTQRFIREAAGAPRAVGSSIPIPRPAFQQRIDRMKESEVDPSQGPAGPQTEEAIELGLEFLARTQRQDGRWRLQDYDTEVLIRSDTAATGLSVLVFQGAGYTHRQFKYARTVNKALAFLVANQKPNGDLYLPQDPASDQNGWLYSHSIAALALCEAYGMTQDPALREPAQRAVQFMVISQDPQYGGWRYRPGRGTDTSVTGWFMMALQSAQLSGLEVPLSTRAGVQRWLVASRGEGAESYLYRYNPNAANTAAQRHGLVPNPTMTSVGLLMGLYNGGEKGSPEMIRAANYLLDHLPRQGNSEKSLRDTYYWYYSTQVMYHMGGAYWQKWYESLYPMLIRTQVREGKMSGSWEPLGEVPDLWGKYGGRLYVTTMNLLSLEVHYRHLPLYESTAQPSPAPAGER